MAPNYTIRISGNSMAEVSDVAFRLAEEPRTRPPGASWNLTDDDHRYQIKIIISGVTTPDDLRSALRGAASEMEKDVTQAGLAPHDGLWVQFQPIA